MQVKTYVLHLREKGRSPSSINIAVCGMRFFFTYTLPRDWGVFELLVVRPLSTVCEAPATRATNLRNGRQLQDDPYAAKMCSLIRWCDRWL